MFQGELVQTALAQVHRKPPPLYEVRGRCGFEVRFYLSIASGKEPSRASSISARAHREAYQA